MFLIFGKFCNKTVINTDHIKMMRPTDDGKQTHIYLSTGYAGNAERYKANVPLESILGHLSIVAKDVKCPVREVKG
jgi:hypothetical protein